MIEQHLSKFIHAMDILKMQYLYMKSMQNLMTNPSNTLILKSIHTIKRYSQKTTITYSWKSLKHHCAAHSKIHYIHSSSSNAQIIHEIDAESYDESNQYIYI